MTNEELKAKVLAIVPNAAFEEGKQYPEVTVAQNKVHPLIKALKEDADTSLDYLWCLSGVDYGDSLGVVYHLESVKHRHMLVIKTKTMNLESPTLDSVCDIFQTAEFHEREVYDLFGISFKNHPDLRRIFLEEDWIGYPLRKNYKDDINIVER